jgi:hypothetical protein
MNAMFVGVVPNRAGLEHVAPNSDQQQDRWTTDSKLNKMK